MALRRRPNHRTSTAGSQTPVPFTTALYTGTPPIQGSLRPASRRAGGGTIPLPCARSPSCPGMPTNDLPGAAKWGTPPPAHAIRPPAPWGEAQFLAAGGVFAAGWTAADHLLLVSHAGYGIL